MNAFGTPGHTPMVGLVLDLPGRRVRLSLKLEGCNPLGSIKDRTATAMLDALDAEGRLSPGQRLIESSSGNLAVALAGRCRQRGIAFTAVVDPKVTPENLNRLRALEADIVQVQHRDASGGYLLTRLEEVKRRCASDPRLVWTDQYHNPANPAAHTRGTGPEVHAQMGDAEAVFIAVSTGGTFSGVTRYFTEAAPDIRVIAVDVEGSVALGHPTSSERHLPGIGAGRRSNFLPDDGIPPCEVVPEHEAVMTCCWLEEAAGLPVGASSGAAIAAGLRYLARERTVEHIVCLCPDFGKNYRSTVYDAGWRDQHAFDIAPPPPIRVIERPVVDRRFL
ncbi:MAG: pyridoxal-phosphate dependent enzyme [Myxococcota bacterium]